jgi:hypothetical protein
MTENADKPETDKESEKPSKRKEFLKYYGGAILVTAATVAILVFWAFPESTKRLAESIDKANQAVGGFNSKNDDLTARLKSLQTQTSDLSEQLSKQQVALTETRRKGLEADEEARQLLQLLKDYKTSPGQVKAVLQAIHDDPNAAMLLGSLRRYDESLSAHESRLQLLTQSLQRVYTDAQYRAPDPIAWQQLLVEHYTSFVKKDLEKATLTTLPSTRPSEAGK